MTYGVSTQLAEVRERIVNALRARRAQELEQAYLNDLAAKLGIAINQIELAKLQATCGRHPSGVSDAAFYMLDPLGE